MIWLPVVESDFGVARFFEDEPNELFHNGKFAKANVITGITANEFISPVAGNAYLN